MNKLIKKYISLILIIASSFMTFPVSAMKTAKTQIAIPSYGQLITTDNQQLSRSSSLTTISRQSDISQNNPIIKRHYGTQRNRLLKECLHEIMAAIKSLFQKQSDIDISITA